jgi:hypothetical protein
MPRRERNALLALMGIPILIAAHVALYCQQSRLYMTQPYVAMVRSVPAAEDRARGRSPDDAGTPVPRRSSRYVIIDKAEHGS